MMTYNIARSYSLVFITILLFSCLCQDSQVLSFDADYMGKIVGVFQWQPLSPQLSQQLPSHSELNNKIAFQTLETSLICIILSCSRDVWFLYCFVLLYFVLFCFILFVCFVLFSLFFFFLTKKNDKVFLLILVTYSQKPIIGLRTERI